MGQKIEKTPRTNLSGDGRHLINRNTGVFPAVPGFKIADIAAALLEQGYVDILSIQVSSQTKVTFSDSQILQRLCDNNFILGEETVLVLPFVKPTIELQIFDVPVWVEDNVIIQALSCFGRVVGEIRHGFVKASNGSRIGTGVRFCSFIKTVPIPSYVCSDLQYYSCDGNDAAYIGLCARYAYTVSLTVRYRTDLKSPFYF